jgi:hypothetical protein
MRHRVTRAQEATMIVVRNRFIAKPGNAGKLAALMKQLVAAGKLPNGRVLTDMTGDFNQVVMEYDVENLAGVEKYQRMYATDETIKAMMKGYTDLWLTGSRELLQVV